MRFLLLPLVHFVARPTNTIGLENYVNVALQRSRELNIDMTAGEVQHFVREVVADIKLFLHTEEVRSLVANAMSPFWDLESDQPTAHIAPPAVSFALEYVSRSLSDGNPGAQCLIDPSTLTDSSQKWQWPWQWRWPWQKIQSTRTHTLLSAAQELWTIEQKDRLYGDKKFKGKPHFSVDTQKKARNGQDTASGPLFRFVDYSWLARPTVKAFIDLLDNYHRETGTAEMFGAKERGEVDRFLDDCMKTPQFHFLRDYLKAKHKCCERGKPDLQKLVHDLWFTPYKREKTNDTSGFEHVFVGEERRGAIIGFHNWIQFYLEEKKHAVDYLGWTGPPPTRDSGRSPAVVSARFRWDDNEPHEEIKPISTFIVGTTPEFELALLTAAFLTGATGKNRIQLGEVKLTCTCYRSPARSKLVGTAYLSM